MFSHIGKDGLPTMVDVSQKAETVRYARAAASVIVSKKHFDTIKQGDSPKGNIFITARIAGISAAKHTSDLIPLCHPLRIGKTNVSISVDEQNHSLNIESYVAGVDRTGFEMEALTAASVASLVIYDMIKSLDKMAVISNIRLLEKDGGKSGHIVRD